MGVYIVIVVYNHLLFWIYAVMFGIAASCTIASHAASVYSVLHCKAGSSETNSEVVESSKWFVMNAA